MTLNSLNGVMTVILRYLPNSAASKANYEFEYNIITSHVYLAIFMSIYVPELRHVHSHSHWIPMKEWETGSPIPKQTSRLLGLASVVCD